MTKITSPFVLILTVSFLSGCVPVEPVAVSAKNNIAISAVRDSQKTYPQGSVFSLEPRHAKETSLKPKKIEAIYQLYSNSIIKNIEDYGFNYSADHSSADFHVGFGLALSDDFSDKKLSELFGLSPGLTDDKNLNKGSFIIYIKDAATKKMIWRGAVQGFASKNLSTEQRKVSAQAIVNQVMEKYFHTIPVTIDGVSRRQSREAPRAYE